MASKKTLCITGATGFIGSNLIRTFLRKSYDVHCLVRKESNHWRLQEILSNISLHEVVIEEETSVVGALELIQPEVVVHCATYGAYQSTQQDIDRTIQTNTVGTIHLMNAAHKVGVHCFINTGTNSEYGSKDHPMKESEMLEPNNLYGITKAAATLYGQMLVKKYSFPLVTLRLFGVYGAFEEKTRLIPTVVLSCLKQESRLSLSSPYYVRDFIYIDDVLDAYLKVIEKKDSIKGEIFNIGSGMQHTIAEVAEIVKHQMQSSIEVVYGSYVSPQHEPNRWVADVSKAKQFLDWSPRYTLEQGLQETIDWFSLHKNLYVERTA